MRKGIANTLWVLVILLGAGYAVYQWDASSKEQQAALDAEEEEFYLAPRSEFLLQLPTGWTVTERSTEEDESVFLELEGPRNDVVDKIFQLDGGTGSIADSVIGRDFTRVIDTPSGKDYALLVIEATSGVAYKLPESKTPYKDRALEGSSVASGVIYGDFIDFESIGGDGYKYDATVSTSSGTVDITNYYLLGDLAEIDAFFYPADSAFAEDAQAIMENIKIFSIQELEDAATQIYEIQEAERDPGIFDEIE